MAQQIPEFGVRYRGAQYLLRPGGYVVLFRSDTLVAVVSTPRGYMLPGGGQEAGETLEAAVVREVAEECGLRVVPGRAIGVADELVFAAEDGCHYRKRCSFFLARIAGVVRARDADHALAWVTATRAVHALRHGSQRWAVAQACLLRGSES